MFLKKSIISILLIIALAISYAGSFNITRAEEPDAIEPDPVPVELNLIELDSRVLDPIEQFVERMYNIVLNRDSEEQGLIHWSGILRSRRMTGAQVAHAFFFCPEFINRDVGERAFVIILYETLMDREPSEWEIQHWLHHIWLGWPLDNVFSAFVHSAEFGLRCQEAGIVQGRYTPPAGGMARVFATQLYRGALGREPDLNGLNSWHEQLRTNRMSGTEAAQSFLFSAEANNRGMTDEEFITAVYLAMLGRVPDAGGAETWLRELQTHGSRHNIFVQFARSSEFDNICRTHGLVRGAIPALERPRPIPGNERIYFGNLHAHTTLSDGRGTVENAFAYARDVARLDFFAVTDHSEHFDQSTSAIPSTINLNTHNATSSRWRRGRTAAANASRDGSFVGIFGYEVTWDRSLGHILTLNTGGFVSTNNPNINARSNDSGLRAYYEILKRTDNSISIFAHPGLVEDGYNYGNFNNFAHHDAAINQRIMLIEVMNGEGPIGSREYWRLTNQYIMALDRGWKLAPVASQDNHRERWGTANGIRTAIWTNDLSHEGVMQALRNMRVYATEVADLEIVYRVNGEIMGSTIRTVPSSANFTAEIRNPSAGNIIKSVEVVTNGGRRMLSAYPNSQNFDYNMTQDSPAQGYYFLWVVVGTPQGDRIAVTAPVWLG